MVNRDPHPDEEGFRVHLSTLAQAHVKIGVEKRFLTGKILIEDDGSYGKRGVEGCVAEHEHAVVDGNGDVVEDDGEGHLQNGDDESSMDYELTQGCCSFVGIAAMPKKKLLGVLKLLHRDI